MILQNIRPMLELLYRKFCYLPNDNHEMIFLQGSGFFPAGGARAMKTSIKMYQELVLLLLVPRLKFPLCMRIGVTNNIVKISRVFLMDAPQLCRKVKKEH